MRFVEVNDGLRLRLPGQSADFMAGFEMGALASYLSFELRDCTRLVLEENLEQAREIAEALRYRMVAGPVAEGRATVHFLLGQLRPALRIVAGN